MTLVAAGVGFAWGPRLAWGPEAGVHTGVPGTPVEIGAGVRLRFARGDTRLAALGTFGLAHFDDQGVVLVEAEGGVTIGGATVHPIVGIGAHAARWFWVTPYVAGRLDVIGTETSGEVASGVQVPHLGGVAD